MPTILAWLIGGLVSAAGTLVGKVLISLGIGYVVYTGVDTSLAWAKAQFVSNLAGIPAKALQMAALAKVGVCVSMLISALTTRVLMQGMTSGAIKRMVVK
jgi:Protein of unknown function (DUF2523)